MRTTKERLEQTKAAVEQYFDGAITCDELFVAMSVRVSEEEKERFGRELQGSGVLV
jgi:hypothetical protein